MILKLVELKPDKLKHLTRNFVSAVYIGQLFPIMLIIFPLMPKLGMNIILIIQLIFFIAFWVLFIASFYKYDILKNSDYLEIGKILLLDKECKIELNDEISIIDLTYSTFKFEYGFIRAKSVGGKSDLQRGISRLTINGTQYHLLVETYKQADRLAKIFKHWYDNNINLNEFSLGTNYRLIELNPKFDWKRLEKIKAHNKA